MALFQTQFDRDLGDSVSGLLTCRHLLFEEEKDYVICPACGELLTKKLPQDSQNKARLYFMQKRIKENWNVKLSGLTMSAVLIIAVFLPIILSWLMLQSGDYGFQEFIVDSNHRYPITTITALAYLPLIFFFLGGERFKRSVLFSLGLQRLYKIWYSWPVMLFLFIFIFNWVRDYGLSLFQIIGQGHMARHDYLTQEQRNTGVELYIFINVFSVRVVAVSLIIYQIFERLKTQFIKQANEAYLAEEV